MDRVLEQSTINKQKQKKWVYALVGVAVLAAGIYGVRELLTSSVSRSKIITDTVKRGEVSSTINASGTVIPAYEQTVTSPLQAELVSILKTPGTKVKAGEPILELNTHYAELNLDKLKDGLELEKARFSTQKLSLEKNVHDLNVQKQLKELELLALKAEKEKQLKLREAGGGTDEAVEQAEMNVKIAEIELEQLKYNLDNQQDSKTAQLKEMQLNINVQQKSMNEQQQKLQDAGIRAQQDGIITWVFEQIGATIREGQEVAKVADLSTFKIRGAIADDYAQSLRTGMDVRIKANNKILEGKISEIQPAATNGVVTFFVSVPAESSRHLRPEMQVNLYLVTASSSDVLYVKRGSALGGRKQQDIFVIRDSEAIKTTIETGLTSFERVEIKSGLQVGDEVIISDMTQYEHSKAVRITN
jgi:HlyD family secretion protein